MEMRATSVMVPVMEATAVKVTDTQTAVRIAKGILAATQANNGENKRPVSYTHLSQGESSPV